MSIASNYWVKTFYTLNREELPDLVITTPSTIEIDTSKPPELLPATLNEENCPIVYKTLSECNVRAKLPCNHHFQARAIKSWFNKKTTCPTCRADGSRERLQYYVTADKVASNFPYLQQQCQKSNALIKQQDEKEQLSTRVAFPVKKYIPSSTSHTPSIYFIKPEYEKLVKNAGFRLSAMLVNTVQHVALATLKLIKWCVVISAAPILFSANVISHLLGGIAVGAAIRFLIIASIVRMIVLNANPITPFLDAAKLGRDFGYNISLVPLSFILTGLEHSLIKMIRALSTHHTPSSIWNHSLTVIPNNHNDNNEIISDENINYNETPFVTAIAITILDLSPL